MRRSASGALGPRLASLGHRIVYGYREPERKDIVEFVSRREDDASATTSELAAAEAGNVIFAEPGLVVEQITRGFGDLFGKILTPSLLPLLINQAL